MNIKFNDKFIKYILTGILNTFFGFSIYALFISLNFNVEYSLFFATIVGVIFNYFSNSKLVFDKSLSLKIFMKFISFYSIVYFCNIFTVKILNKIISDLYLSGLISICIFAVISFFVFNLLIFKN